VLSLSSCLKSRWIVQAKRRSKHELNNIPLQDVAGGQDQVYSMQSVTLKDELSYLSTSEIGQNIKKNARGKHMRQFTYVVSHKRYGVRDAWWLASFIGCWYQLKYLKSDCRLLHFSP